MSKIYYVKDKNGTFLSPDGKTRYTKLEGKNLYNFLNSDDGKRRIFHEEIDEDGNCVGFETASRKNKGLPKEAEREKYLYNVRTELKITITSSNELVSLAGEDDIELIQALGDKEVNVEADAVHSLDLETLQSALKTLTKEEYEIIYALYLSQKPMSERELSAKTGIPRMTINYRKKRILRKLKKFF